MSDIAYLNRLFKAYYKENKSYIPQVSSFTQREFGFIPWEEKVFMKRHMSFEDHEGLINHLIENGPKHVYSSGALYLQPNHLDMDKKDYQGCDLIIDIDVDHFYTPCKDDHDLWYCKECDGNGKGMPSKCPKCGGVKFKTLNWICDDCLNVAKNEITKLIYDFLVPDFGIPENVMRISFSGHRGYHLKVENDKVRSLSSEDRREIADYVTGDNISLEVLGLREYNQDIYGLIKDNVGWSEKIVTKIEYLLKNYSDLELEHFLLKLDINRQIIKSFINSKQDFLETIDKNRNLWVIPNFGMVTWKKLLYGIVHEISAEIDEPVTIDIHRLIRYPGSLHGKTGFKVQELTIKELEDFNPLDELRKELDPIVFKSDITQKLEITETCLPITKIHGIKYGPYSKGEVIEVPNHIAVFLLAKEVAKTI